MGTRNEERATVCAEEAWGSAYENVAILALQVLDEGIDVLILLLIQRSLLLGHASSVVRVLLLLETTTGDVGREGRGGARGRRVRHDAINELGARGGCVDAG